MRHFEAALTRVTPSVSRKDQRLYDALRLRLRSNAAHLAPQVLIGGSALARPRLLS
jgi:hypothetical protein